MTQTRLLITVAICSIYAALLAANPSLLQTSTMNFAYNNIPYAQIARNSSTNVVNFIRNNEDATVLLTSCGMSYALWKTYNRYIQSFIGKSTKTTNTNTSNDNSQNVNTKKKTIDPENISYPINTGTLLARIEGDKKPYCIYPSDTTLTGFLSAYNKFNLHHNKTHINIEPNEYPFYTASRSIHTKNVDLEQLNSVYISWKNIPSGTEPEKTYSIVVGAGPRHPCILVDLKDGYANIFSNTQCPINNSQCTLEKWILKNKTPLFLPKNTRHYLFGA